MIDRKANAQAAKIEGHVARICDDMQAIQTTQNQVAALVVLQDSITATLPAFRPYAVLTQDKVRACRAGTGVASDAVRMAAGVARWGGRTAHAASTAGKTP